MTCWPALLPAVASRGQQAATTAATMEAPPTYTVVVMSQGEKAPLPLPQPHAHAEHEDYRRRRRAAVRTVAHRDLIV